ncbi:MAG: hypothetical protein EP343_06305 [Deltaproteobacteria bacterium]|nr:MAG: hypothetical protein EP343_06305 [Deltaproteobacteria bacterium]
MTFSFVSTFLNRLPWIGILACALLGALVGCGLQGYECFDDNDCSAANRCLQGWCRQRPPATVPSRRTPVPPPLVSRQAPVYIPPFLPISQDSSMCQRGAQRSCFSGPTGLSTKGPCHAGVQRCRDGQWGACEGQVLPQTEICNGQDDDCDGLVDERLGCGCVPGMSRPCYTGPEGTKGVGGCAAGTQTCEATKTWGACHEQQVPQTETCNEIDDDCDGKVQETCQACFLTREVHQLSGHSGPIQALAFGPQEQLLATASSDNNVHLWDVKTGRLITKLEGHGHSVMSVEFNTAGTHLVTASLDNTVRIWSLRTRKVEHVFHKHNRGINSARFDPTGAFVVSAGRDGMLLVWNVTKGTQVRSWKATKGEPTQLAFHPQGKLWVVGDNLGNLHARTWPEGKLLRSWEAHIKEIRHLRFREDGRRLMSVSRDNSYKLWNPWQGSLLHLHREQSRTLESATFRPGSRQILTAWHYYIRTWREGENQTLESWSGNSRPIVQLETSPQGNWLASVDEGNIIKLWQCPP